MFIPFLLFLVLALYNVVLGYVVLQRTRHYPVGRNFAWCLLSIAAWTLCGAVMVSPGLSHTLALWTARSAFFFAVGIGVSWLWFCADFPHSTRRFSMIAIVLTLLGIPWLFFSWTALLFTDTIALPWWRYGVTGALVPLYTVWLSTAMGAGFIHLWRKRTSVRGRERLQILYVMSGFLVSFAVALTFNLLLPILTRTSAYAPLGTLAPIALSTSTACAIVRYRLLEVNVILRAVLLNALTILLLALAALLPLAFFTHHFPRDLQQSMLVLFLEILIVALVFQPVQFILQRQHERWFSTGRLPLRSMLHKAANTFANLHEPATLYKQLAGILADTLGARAVAVYIPDGAGALHCQLTTAPWDELPKQVMIDDLLPAAVLAAEDLLVSDECLCYREPWHSVGRQLKGWRAELVFILRSGKECRGVLVVGDKHSGDVYSGEEISLLHILSEHAGIALENARYAVALQQLNAELEQRVQERTSELSAAVTQLETVNRSFAAEQAFLSSAIEILPLPLFFLSGMGEITLKNKAFLDFLQREEVNDIHQVKLLDPFADVLIPDAERPSVKALHGKVTPALEARLLLPDAREIPVITCASPVYVGEEVVAAVVVVQDIIALKEADRAKNEFLAILSHELLTPITSIKGWADVARAMQDPVTTERALEVIQRNNDRLNRLVDDLLDVSRIVHNKLMVIPQQIDLWQLVEQQVEGALQVIDKRKILLMKEPPTEALPVYVDPVRFAQVINNLLNNALKFTPDGGTITLHGRRVEDQAELQISDTGKGVLPEYLPRLFHPFIQQENDGGSRGLGLGLALVKGIVDLHHGRVAAASAGLDQGSTFTITVPLASPTPAAETLL